MNKYLSKLSYLITVPAGLLLAFSFILLVIAAQLFNGKGKVMQRELKRAIATALREYRKVGNS